MEVIGEQVHKEKHLACDVKDLVDVNPDPFLALTVVDPGVHGQLKERAPFRAGEQEHEPSMNRCVSEQCMRPRKELLEWTIRVLTLREEIPLQWVIGQEMAEHQEHEQREWIGQEGRQHRYFFSRDWLNTYSNLPGRYMPFSTCDKSNRNKLMKGREN